MAEEESSSMVNQVMDQLRGFMQARAIITASELDLFTKIEEKPATAFAIANANTFNLKGLIRLLDYLIVIDLLRKENSCYFITEKGSYFSSNHKESILPVVLMFNSLCNSWSLLTKSISKKPIVKNNVIINTEAMHTIGRKLSKDVADYFDASNFSRLLDIGGASGTYTIAFLNKNPNMKAIIYDLKEVIPMAKKRIKSERLLNRVTFVEGDFYNEELPKGCDLVLLSAIIHQNSPEENTILYRKIANILQPGGTLLIRDHIMNDSRTAPTSGVLFALNMFVHKPGGDTYTFTDVKNSLKDSGFGIVKLIKVGNNMDCLVEAKL